MGKPPKSVNSICFLQNQGMNGATTTVYIEGEHTRKFEAADSI